MNRVSIDYLNPPPLFDVGAVWATLWRRRILIVTITLGVLFAAGLYIVVTKPSYTAGAAILVDPRDLKTTNIDSVLPGIGADSAAIASQVSVIESRDFLGKVFADLHLDADPDYSSNGFASQLLGLFRPTKPIDPEAVFQRFQSTVSVDREGLTYVIDVNVKSPDPVKAARIANAIVELYISGTAAQQTTATNDVTTTLNGKIAALETDVSQADQAVEDFKQKNQIFDETTGGTLQSQVDALSGQVIAAQDALDQAETKYDQAVAAGKSAEALSQLSDIWSSPATEKLRDDYNTRAAALASAQATFGPKHPNVIQAKAELSKVQGLLIREAARITKELKSNRDLARTALAKTTQSLDALRQKSSQSDVAEVQLRALQRKADAARSVLADFQKRSQETSQMGGLQSSQVHVISSAAPPPEPTWPKPMLLLPVSALLGLLLGSGTALMLGDGALRRAPAPRPAPAGPGGPRGEPRNQVDVPTAVSPARRYAGLDAARREMFSTTETALSRSIQRLLRQVLAALPKHQKPYVLALSSVRHPDLAQHGARLVAMGLERIGARTLIVSNDEAVGAAQAADYDFILVDEAHDLAGSADVDILVLTPEEARLRPASAAHNITLVLESPAVGPKLVASNANLTPIRAAG